MKRCCVKVDIKLFYQEKGFYWRGVKIMIMGTVKNFLGPENKPAFSLSLKLHVKNILYLFIFCKNVVHGTVYIQWADIGSRIGFNRDKNYVKGNCLRVSQEPINLFIT